MHRNLSDPTVCLRKTLSPKHHHSFQNNPFIPLQNGSSATLPSSRLMDGELVGPFLTCYCRVFGGGGNSPQLGWPSKGKRGASGSLHLVLHLWRSSAPPGLDSLCPVTPASLPASLHKRENSWRREKPQDRSPDVSSIIWALFNTL